MIPPETPRDPFDPSSPSTLPEVEPSGTLLLLWTDGAAEEGWAGAASLALARGWKDEGKRVFLCDVALEAPTLHGAADLPNGEGMSDALRYGTSFRRVAHRLEANLFLATAGTVAVDAGGSGAMPGGRPSPPASPMRAHSSCSPVRRVGSRWRISPRSRVR